MKAEYIIKIDGEPDIMGNYPLKDKPHELVRCKDCKHGSIDQSGINGVWCPAHAEWHENNWFCADGERKET